MNAPSERELLIRAMKELRDIRRRYAALEFAVQALAVIIILRELAPLAVR